VSFADKAKTKAPKRVTLEAWLEALPEKEREGALHMLKTPKLWSLPDLVAEFREEGGVFGRDAFAAWRKANDVVRR
jgi:hypothetical protein